MSKKRSLEESGTSYEQKFNCSHSLGQKIWNKVRISSEIARTELEKFDICFCALFDCYCQSFIYGRENEPWALSLHPNLRFLQYFLIYLDPKSEDVWQLASKVFYTR